LFTVVSGLPFFLTFFSSFDLENKKSPVILLLEAVFLMYPSISAPFSVLKLFENSMSPFTTPEEPMTTLSAETLPSRCP
jgi:hypothetical protein